MNSFSNRCFFTKAISIWTSTGDADHVMIVGAYFHYAGGFEPPQVRNFVIINVIYAEKNKLLTSNVKRQPNRILTSE